MIIEAGICTLAQYYVRVLAYTLCCVVEQEIVPGWDGYMGCLAEKLGVSGK